MANPCIGAHSLLDTHTVTTTPSADASFPKTNLYDDRSYDLFKPTSSGTTVDIVTDAGVGLTADVDYLAILNHDLLSPAGSGAACTWTFAHSADNVSYTTIATATPTVSTVIFRKFAATYTNRYFRLRITRGAAFICAIGELQWGVAVQFPYGLEFPYDPGASRIEGQLNRSQTGKIIGAIRTHEFKEHKLNFPLVLYSWAYGTTVGQFGEFWTNHARLLKPFIYSWNPGDPGSYEADAYWAIFKPTDRLGRPLVTPLATGYVDIEFTVEGEA